MQKCKARHSTGATVITSASVLIVTVGYIAVVWTWVLHDIGKMDFLYPSEQRRWANRRVLFLLLLVAALWGLGESGYLAEMEVSPPPLIFFIAFVLILPVLIAFSKLGTKIIDYISLPWLVAFQSFRLLAEIVIYLGVAEGLAPVQMSFEGYNFDIVTGLSAPFVALLLARRKSKRLGWLWNLMGMGFLFIVLGIAATSMPNEFRLFTNEPSSLWVTQAPYILLPGILVMTAFTVHWLAIRSLIHVDSADGLRFRHF